MAVIPLKLQQEQQRENCAPNKVTFSDMSETLDIVQITTDMIGMGES